MKMSEKEIMMYYIYGILFFSIGLFLSNLVFTYQNKYIDPAFWPTFKYQLAALPVFLIANIFIGYGIKFAFRVIGNQTFVLAGSKGIEMIIFLVLGYLFFQEVPTWKTLLGLGLVISGLIVAKA